MLKSNISMIVTGAHERWNAAFNSGDASAVAALYTEDGTVLPHTNAVVRGREAITEFWSSLISAGVKEHGIELLDAHQAGEIAYANGKWWATGLGENGKSKRFGGTIVTILRKQTDGTWRTCLHTWN